MKMLPLLGILLFSTSIFAQSNEKQTIVFVCEHGGARSTIASVYFNKMARENHLLYHSIFRALTPDSTISKETKNGLSKDGFETASLVPVALTLKDVDTNVMLISLDCMVPSSYHTDKSWNGIPAISNDYPVARNTIVKMLEELISELKNKKSTSH
jgi:arsenate reductase